jgi:hypothetical protein
VEALHLSARAHDRILKVARTLADLEGSARIGPGHVSEAVQYRPVYRATRDTPELPPASSSFRKFFADLRPDGAEHPAGASSPAHQPEREPT